MVEWIIQRVAQIPAELFEPIGERGAGGSHEFDPLLVVLIGGGPVLFQRGVQDRLVEQQLGHEGTVDAGQASREG